MPLSLLKQTCPLVHTRIDKDCHDKIPGITERLNVYEILWIKSGNLVLESNLKTYALAEGSICCLAPGQVRRLRFSEDSRGDYLALEAGYFYRICTEVKFPLITLDTHHLGKPMLISVKEHWAQESDDSLQQLRRLSQAEEVAEDLLNMWLRVFLIYLKKHIDIKDEEQHMFRDMDLVNDFMRLLSGKYATKKMVAAYALELHVTPHYLNQIVKRVSGFSVSHHIQQFLIIEAKRQAMASNKSMKQIAYDLGFVDTAHFSKYFKNNAGINFTDFKKEIKLMQL
jgi:AraC family transcriptional activator of pobA